MKLFRKYIHFTKCLRWFHMAMVMLHSAGTWSAKDRRPASSRTRIAIYNLFFKVQFMQIWQSTKCAKESGVEIHPLTLPLCPVWWWNLQDSVNNICLFNSMLTDSTELGHINIWQSRLVVYGWHGVFASHWTANSNRKNSAGCRRHTTAISVACYKPTKKPRENKQQTMI